MQLGLLILVEALVGLPAIVVIRCESVALYVCRMVAESQRQKQLSEHD